MTDMVDAIDLDHLAKCLTSDGTMNNAYVGEHFNETPGWTALAAEVLRLSALADDLTAEASPLGAVVKPLPRNESSRIGGWTIPADVLCAIRDEAGEWAEESYLETVECICLATEARILAALQPPNHAAQIAVALALPEVAALRDAATTVHEILREAFPQIACVGMCAELGKALAALKARHD